MHRSAETLVESCRAGEDLRHCSVEQEPHTEFLGASLEVLSGHGHGCSVPEFVHNLPKLLFREDLDAAQSLREDFAVGTVASEDKVVCIKGICHTDSGRFLTCGKVGWTRVVV